MQRSCSGWRVRAKEENVGVFGSCQLVSVEWKRKGKGDEYRARI